jgi:hypothetical protein
MEKSISYGTWPPPETLLPETLQIPFFEKDKNSNANRLTAPPRFNDPTPREEINKLLGHPKA